MRFMILVKASTDSEAGETPDEKWIAKMAEYHEKLLEAGVLLGRARLHPSAKGWRIRYLGGERAIVDGPFAETHERIAGYTMIQVKSREEAIEWTKRFPNPRSAGAECEIEVGQLRELADFDPRSRAAS